MKTYKMGEVKGKMAYVIGDEALYRADEVFLEMNEVKGENFTLLGEAGFKRFEVVGIEENGEVRQGMRICR